MKPRKIFFYLSVMLFAFSLCGCVVHPGLYKSNDDIEKETNPALWKKVADLEQQNQIRKEKDAALDGKMAAVQSSLFKIDASLKAMSDQLRQLNAGLPGDSAGAQPGDGSRREIAGEAGVPKEAAAATGTAGPVKKGAVATMQDEMTDLQQRLKRLEDEGRKAQTEAEKAKAASSTPSIVVVSGTGKAAAAKKMALRLAKLGYRVDRIAQTPQKGYSKNVVYYAEPNRETAARLASRLGGKTVLKPMDWQSKYGIAVISTMK